MELRGVRHLGWQCTARLCGARFTFSPTDDLDADRQASRLAAEAVGWVFTHDMPCRWDGQEYLGTQPWQQHCPRHAPVAAARAALRLAKAAPMNGETVPDRGVAP